MKTIEEETEEVKKETVEVVEEKNEAQDIMQAEPDPDAPRRWQKIGGGSFRLNTKRIIKPGEKFTARPSQIPRNFRDVVIPLDGSVEVPNKTEPTAMKGKKPSYTSKPSEKRTIKNRGKSKSLFDVFEEDGTKINDAPLKKDDAAKLLGFDVIGPDGKTLNEKPLPEEKVEMLLKNLNA